MLDSLRFRLRHSRYAHLWTEYGAEAIAAEVGPVVLVILAAVALAVIILRSEP